MARVARGLDHHACRRKVGGKPAGARKTFNDLNDFRLMLGK